jgi:Do/DeqQ family serine protease
MMMSQALKSSFVRAVALGSMVSLCSAVTPAQASPPSIVDNSPIAAATQLGLAFSRVAEQTSPSVVSIRVEVKRETPSFGFFFPFGGNGEGGDVQRGSGSGVVLSADGAILTNNHVVANASRIEVQLKDGRRLKARVVGVDAATDLAVLRIDAKNLPAIRFADSDAAVVGQWVVAIGSPFGLDYTVTTGVLSAKGRGGLGANEIEDYLQTDASINPGNSGGPLVNLHGELLGINTMIIGHASGIGFAIPSNLVKRVADELLAKGGVHRAWIGVSYQELTPELASSFGIDRTRGALVNDVVAGGPADKAGVKAGDIILDVAGKEVHEGRDLLRIVLLHEVGKSLPITVMRDGGRKKLSLVTTERPSNEEVSQRKGQRSRSAPGPTERGLDLAPLTPDLARRLGYRGPGGVVVVGVQTGSPAERAQLTRGDVIEEVNKARVTHPKEVEEALSKGSALLKLHRRGGTFFAVIE